MNKTNKNILTGIAMIVFVALLVVLMVKVLLPAFTPQQVVDNNPPDDPNKTQIPPVEDPVDPLEVDPVKDPIVHPPVVVEDPPVPIDPDEADTEIPEGTPTGVLFGKVTRKVDGKPISGAKLFVQLTFGGVNHFLFSTLTDDKGQYRFDKIPTVYILHRESDSLVMTDSISRMVVTAEEFALVSFNNIVPETEVEKEINAEMVPGVFFSGRVTDNYKNPIENVNITAWSPMIGHGNDVRTDGSGHYEMVGLHPDILYSFTLDHEDFGFDFKEEHEVELAEGEIRDDVNFVMSVLPRIIGTVTNTEGDPIPEVTIEIFLYYEMFQSLSSIPQNDFIKTDDQGNYQTFVKAEGRIIVTAEKEGYQMILQETELYGEEEVEIDFILDEGFSISGRVATDDGTPVASVHLYAEPPWISGGEDALTDILKASFDASSDEQGNFIFTGLQERNYKIIAVGNDELVMDIDDMDSGQTVFSAGSVDVLMVMHKIASISGRVVDPDGNPVKEIAVIAQAYPESKRYDFYMSGGNWTDSAGNFFADVQKGTYSFYIEPKGKYYFYSNEPISIEWGETYHELEFQLQLGGTIEGIVRDSAGKPAANTNALLKPNLKEMTSLSDMDALEIRTRYHRSTNSDQEGKFFLPGVEPGSYILRIHGYESEIIKREITIYSGEELILEFDLIKEE